MEQEKITAEFIDKKLAEIEMLYTVIFSLKQELNKPQNGIRHCPPCQCDLTR